MCSVASGVTLRRSKSLLSDGSNENNYDNSEPIRSPRRHKFRYQQKVPPQFTNSLMPTNAFEQKNRFLTRKITPEFHLNVPTMNLESSLVRAHRSFNEGHQPWYGKREIYGFGSTQSCEAIAIEEGLACLHTVLRAKHQYLGVSALLYYGSCMAEYLPFKELFEHLGKYVINEEQRWKHCMRVKRCLLSQDKCGGYGKDQRYFEGAITILRQQANIDFPLLMSGKLTLGELERARRCVVMSTVRLPYFMHDLEKYLKSMRRIAHINGVVIARSESTVRERRQSRLSRTTQMSSASIAASSIEHRLNVPPNLGSTKLFRKASCPPMTRSTNSNDQSLNELNVVQQDNTAITPLVTDEALPTGATQLTYSSSRSQQTKRQSASVGDCNCTLANPKLSVTASVTDVRQASKETEGQESKTNAPNAVLSSANDKPRQLFNSGSILQLTVTDLSANSQSSLGKLEIETVNFPTQSVEPLGQQDIKTQDTLTNDRQQLLEQCAALQLPACNITNSIKFKPDTQKNVTHERRPSRDAVISDRKSFISKMKLLPDGVCGCRIFTHGSLRPENAVNMVKEGSEENDITNEDLYESSVPLFLEIDLKHPLVGVW